VKTITDRCATAVTVSAIDAGVAPMSTSRVAFSPLRLVGTGVLVALVVAMALSTKFLTRAELASIGPKAFNPVDAASGLFAKAQSDLPGRAKPLPEVLTAVQTDIKGAAAKYQAASPSEGTYDFAVTASGTVSDESTADSLRLTVDGVSGTTVIVPTTTAINGAVLRDAMGFKFADAPGQTQYQYVGDELKKLIQSKVIAPLGDPAKLKGKKVTITGVLSVQDIGGTNTVPKAKPANIQPTKIEVAA